MTQDKQQDKKQEMRASTKWAIGVTAIWLSGVAAYVVCNWCKFISMEPNSLGDFLAGTMSPLALFWLVAGYRQQGEELNMNTQALIDQHEVMKLQRAEMAEQVKLYQQMVEQATEQAKATKIMATMARIK